MTADNELPKPDDSPFLSYDPDEDAGVAAASANGSPAPGTQANGTSAPGTAPDSLEPSFREPAARADAPAGVASDANSDATSDATPGTPSGPAPTDAPAPTTRPFYPPPPVITRQDRPAPVDRPDTPVSNPASRVPNDLPEEGIDDLTPSEHTPVSAAGAVQATESMRREAPSAEPRQPDAPGRPGPLRGTPSGTATGATMSRRKRTQLVVGAVLVIAGVVVLVLVLGLL